MAIDIRPDIIQRLSIGLTAPIPEEKEVIWSYVTIPQSGITRETGGYQPARLFKQAHFHPARTVMVAGGPRSGKSLFGSMESLTWTPHSDLIWLAADSYDLCRQEFEYITEALLSLGWTEPRLISFPENRYQPCSVETTWGCLIETKSLKDANTFVARAPDVVEICEPGQTSITSLHRANERLSTKRGKLLLPGTFEESAPWLQQYWGKWKSWPNEDNAKSFSAPTYINHVTFPLGLRDPEIDKLRNQCDTFDEFLLRFVGVPSASADIIFSDSWRERIHVRETKYIRRDDDNRILPVWIMIDPGWGGESRYVVLVAQVFPNSHKIRIFDEVVGRGLTHEQMIRRCMVRDWWPVCDRGTIDPYAGESHPFGNDSPASYWRQKQYGVNLELPQRLHVEELIRMIKTYLTQGNGWEIEIDPRCERLRWEMASWKRIRLPSGLGKPQVANCDAIKALGYFLTHLANGMLGPQQQPVRVLDHAVTMGGYGGIVPREQVASATSWWSS